MKKLTRTLTALLAVLMLALFCTGCGSTAGTEQGTAAVSEKTPLTFAELYEAVAAVVPDSDKLVDVQDSYLSGMFKADAADFANYKIVTQSISTSIDEIGLFEAKSADDVKNVEAIVDAYIALRQEIWDSQYLPEEYPKLRDAQRVTRGNVVMYVILSEETADAAIAAFEANAG